jgi:hypothetical protein
MATWKKLVVSGSDISQLNNDAGYISASQVPEIPKGFATASFDGTDLLADTTSSNLNFTSGSGVGLRITATAGTDTLNFDLDNVPNTSLLNKDITIGTTAIDLGDSSTVLAGLTSVTSTDFTGNLTSTSTLANGVTAVTQGATDNSTLVATTEFVQSVVTQGDLDFSGDLGSPGAVDLDSQTFTITGGTGAGIETTSANQGLQISIKNDSTSGGNIVPLSLTGNGAGIDVSLLAGQGLAAQTGQLVVVPESNLSAGVFPVDVSATGVSFDVSNIVNGNGGLEFDSVNNVLKAKVDNTTIEVSSVNGALQIKDGGVDTDAIADSLGTLGTNQFTGSFTGSFVGDGSGLTGLATDLDIEGDTGTGTIDLQNQTLDIAGGTNINTIAGAQTITVNLNDNITVTDATVNGNLTVLGTASFQHETNLEVADRFILLASGSSTTGDGGIIIQQATQDVGEVFGFDGVTGDERWGVGKNLHASSSAFTADAFMAAVLTGNASSDSAIDAIVEDRYEAKGNLFIGDDEDIWIYS